MTNYQQPELDPKPMKEPLPIQAEHSPNARERSASKKVDDISRHESKYDPKQDPKHDPKHPAMHDPKPDQGQGGKPVSEPPRGGKPTPLGPKH